MAVKYLLAFVAGVLILLASAVGGRAVIEGFYSPPPASTKCLDAAGLHRKHVSSEEADFQECLKAQAKLFLERDYVQFNELAKTFLTLLSATLVASITFSEKVVDVTKAGLLPLVCIVTCWVLLLTAIVSCVIGLAFMANVAWTVTYDPQLNFLSREVAGTGCLLYAVVAFALALSAMVVSGIASLILKRRANLVTD